MFTITIPCKRYVKHHLESRYGNPVKLTERSNIGKYFTRVLEKNHYSEGVKNHREFTERVTIVVSEKIGMKEGFGLSPASITAFNNFVADDFKAEVHLRIDTLVEVNGMRKVKAYDHIYSYYNIDVDVFPLDSLKKSYQRYCDERNRLIFSE